MKEESQLKKSGQEVKCSGCSVSLGRKYVNVSSFSGFLRSDKPIGTALVKLDKLESQSEIREIVEVRVNSSIYDAAPTMLHS